MKKTLIIFTAFLMAVGGLSMAASDQRVGSVGAQFLKIGVGSRYQGLGEASVALVNDAYSMYWNPAGLASIEGSNVTFTNVNWVTDVSLNYVGFGTRLGDHGVVGLSATLLTMGDMEMTTIEQPNGTGQNFSASSMALSVGYARMLTTRLAFGAAVKYVYERIYKESAGGMAFDFGTQLQTGFRSLRIGMNIANMGSQLKFAGPDLAVLSGNGSPQSVLAVDGYDLPLTFRLGMAYDFIDNDHNRLTAALEAKHPNDNEQQASLGSEYCYNGKYFLRAGYKLNYDEQGLTFGGGIQAPLGQQTRLLIDYAWSDFGRLESVHRFSLGFSF